MPAAVTTPAAADASQIEAAIAAPSTETASPASATDLAIGSGDTVELVATNIFSTATYGSHPGVTVTPGARFRTIPTHAEDLKRVGLAKDPEPEADPQA